MKAREATTGFRQDVRLHMVSVWCVWVRVGVRACVHACMRACVHACMRACVHACMRACVHACMRACVIACMRACVSACACVRTYANAVDLYKIK